MITPSPRVRIAPSPTGTFHLGTARTALFNELFARHLGGQFVLRFEDTDQERSTLESEQDIVDGLAWLGLIADESPTAGGSYAPYRQMERLDDYRQAAERLIASGHAYYCFCTAEELAAERQAQEAAHISPKYSGRCRSIPPTEAAERKSAGEPAVVRFKVTGGSRSFTDLVMGTVAEDTDLYGDFVILRSVEAGEPPLPLYNLANVVDDQAMAITHVIRGADLLPSTIKQIMLIEALGGTPPAYAHLPVILSPSGKGKMSKRRDPVSITRDFRDRGYLPEAMINFMALLGWAPEGEREYFSHTELVEAFTLERVNKANAVFNPAKLEHMNGHYIRTLSVEALSERLQPFLRRDSQTFAALPPVEQRALAQQLAEVLQDRLIRLDEAVGLGAWLIEAEVQPPANLLLGKKQTASEAGLMLQAAHAALAEEADWSEPNLEALLRNVAAAQAVGAGAVLWPVRAALTAQAASPGVFTVLSALGKEPSLARLKNAIDILAE